MRAAGLALFLVTTLVPSVSLAAVHCFMGAGYNVLNCEDDQQFEWAENTPEACEQQVHELCDGAGFAWCSGNWMEWDYTGGDHIYDYGTCGGGGDDGGHDY